MHDGIAWHKWEGICDKMELVSGLVIGKWIRHFAGVMTRLVLRMSFLLAGPMVLAEVKLSENPGRIAAYLGDGGVHFPVTNSKDDLKSWARWWANFSSLSLKMILLTSSFRSSLNTSVFFGSREWGKL